MTAQESSSVAQASRTVVRFRRGVLSRGRGSSGGLVLSKLLPPFACLVGLVPGSVEADEPLRGFGEAEVANVGEDFVLTLLQPFVPGYEKRLGVGILLLAPQALNSRRVQWVTVRDNTRRVRVNPW
jgi:hypothetical protein